MINYNQVIALSGLKIIGVLRPPVQRRYCTPPRLFSSEEPARSAGSGMYNKREKYSTPSGIKILLLQSTSGDKPGIIKILPLSGQGSFENSFLFQL
jgi:hypothetical protein